MWQLHSSISHEGCSSWRTPDGSDDGSIMVALVLRRRFEMRCSEKDDENNLSIPVSDKVGGEFGRGNTRCAMITDDIGGGRETAGRSRN